MVGFLPLLVFIFGFIDPRSPSTLYLASTAITALAFFLVGTAKSFFVRQRWYWSGLETLLIGGTAAALAYAVGLLLKGVIGQ
jgi:VIT1/CCC1 family predicted Fe2+/Mn2+ transporter